MTKDEFSNKLYRLQVLQQMTLGVGNLTFKVDTYVTRDGYAAIEWMLFRGDDWLTSGNIIENYDNDASSAKIMELKDFISKRGWV